jgi:carbonic anhydrase
MKLFQNNRTLFSFLFLAAVPAMLVMSSCKKDKKTTEDTCEKWEYEGVTGPDHWVSLCDDYLDCGGMLQSPVNIQAPELDSSLHPLALDYHSTETEIEFNGHTIEFITEGSHSKMLLNGLEYELKQFHFHTFSEHTINGEHAQMELHLVHQEPFTQNRAVIGILFEVGSENEFLSRYIDDLPRVTTPKYSSSLEYNPLEILPENLSYYTYPGSLTTPDCDQNVLWFIMQHPVQASAAQISRIGQIISQNNRPVQPLAGRKVKLFVQ